MNGTTKRKRGHKGRVEPFLSTGQLLDLVGPPMNIYTLQRLRKAGLISAVNKGLPRGKKGNTGNCAWSLGAVVLVKVYCDALHGGMDGRKLHRILRELDRTFGDAEGLAMLARGDAYIVADSKGGGATVQRLSEREYMELKSKQMMLPLGELKELVATVHKMTPPEPRVSRIKWMKARAATG